MVDCPSYTSLIQIGTVVKILVGQGATLRLKFPFPRTRPATSPLSFFSARRVALIPAATECDSQLSHAPEATKGKHSERVSS